MNKITINLEEMDYSTREELKTFRTNLLFSGADKKVIMLTSTVPGEGKTGLAMKLASSLTEVNKKVLLLDLDLRKSVMASRLDSTQVKNGMSHFLSGQCQLSDVIFSTNIPKMHIALAGPTVLNPTELLSSERLQKMLESLREVYDYIIIDSAPLGMVIDGAIIAKGCDGAILVVESGKIKYRQAQEVKAKIENAGCHFLGAVLNKVDIQRDGYYKPSVKYGKYGRYENNGVSVE